MKNHLSIIFLPTNKCNVDCEYCFEDKTDDRLTLSQLSHITSKIFDFLDESNINALTLHWQGGEIMTLPPQWFEEAYETISTLAAARNKQVDHGLQTNMIGYSARWDAIIARMFGNSVGTSMDYPNLYRKLFHAGPDEYLKIWSRNVRAAREAGIKVGVIAVPNQATLAIGAERFYSFFVDELGVTDFQVNTPFPGGEINGTKNDLALENKKLSRFFIDLADIWVERGRDAGVKLGPIDQLVEHFSGAPSCLPCIWQTNCADEFISIDARGYVAQCDCWVTSYPEYFFGNIFESDSLATLLKNSPARKQFLQRPAAILDQGCLECDYLSLCHGGCPVRTYTFRHTLFEKDPYCQLYLSLFRHAEALAKRLASDRFMPAGIRRTKRNTAAAFDTRLDLDPSVHLGPLVQIERRRGL
jgi:uncharacterized protein